MKIVLRLMIPKLNCISLLIFLLSLTLAIPGYAHGYWYELKGNGKPNQEVTLQLCFGEIDEAGVRHREAGEELAAIGNFQVFILDAHGKRQQLTLQAKKDCWQTQFTPQTLGTYQVFAMNDKLPVVERETGSNSIRPIDYLCGTYQVGSALIKTQADEMFLSIQVTPSPTLYKVQAFHQGKSVKAHTKIRIFNPENWEKNLTTTKDGEVFFKPTLKGLYIIRQDWYDPTPGTYQGKSYQSVRHRCNYCLFYAG